MNITAYLANAAVSMARRTPKHNDSILLTQKHPIVQSPPADLLGVSTLSLVAQTIEELIAGGAILKGPKIGVGAFGQVFQGMILETGENVAIKTVFNKVKIMKRRIFFYNTCSCMSYHCF